MEGTTVQEPVRPPALTLSEASERYGVSRSTLRRQLDSGTFPNAWRGPGRGGSASGPWMIPHTDLEAAGLRPGQGERPARTPRAVADPGELLDARLEAERWRVRYESARALADERARRIEDLQRTVDAALAARAVEATLAARAEGQAEPEPLADSHPEAGASSLAMDAVTSALFLVGGLGLLSLAFVQQGAAPPVLQQVTSGALTLVGVVLLAVGAVLVLAVAARAVRGRSRRSPSDVEPALDDREPVTHVGLSRPWEDE